jgi:hypothetical protein
MVKYFELKAKMEENAQMILSDKGFILAKTGGNVSIRRLKHFSITSIEMYTPDW